MSDQSTTAAPPDAPRWIAFAALPILILLTAKFSVQTEPNFGFKSPHDIAFDLEFLQYILAAGLAYYFGKTGIAIVCIAAVFKLFALDTVIQGASFQTSGSLDEAMAMVLVAQAFGPNGGLSRYLNAPSLSPALVAFILIAGAVGLSHRLFSGISLSTSCYVLLLLAAFYLGLSRARLSFGVFLALLACAVSIYLFAFVPGWENPTSLRKWFNLEPTNFWLKTLGELDTHLVLLSPFSVLLLLYTMGVGRGFRQRWLSLDADDYRSAWASALVSLPGLLFAAAIAFLLWDFHTIANYAWPVPLQPNDPPVQPNEPWPFFHSRLSLVSSASILVIPFIGFSLGAIYRATGVWAAALCFLIFVFGAQCLAIFSGRVGFGWMMTDPRLLEFSGRLQFLDLGRGLALPAFAILGKLVAERTQRGVVQAGTHDKPQQA